MGVRGLRAFLPRAKLVFGDALYISTVVEE